MFRNRQEESGLHDIDAQIAKTERHQAYLKQHFSQELEKMGKDAPDYERVKAEFEERDRAKVTESIDSLPVKQKRKWRVW